MASDQDTRPTIPPTPLLPSDATTSIAPHRLPWTVIAASVLVFLAAAPSAALLIRSPWPPCEIGCLGCFLAQKVIPAICAVGGGYLGVQLLRRRSHANWLAPLLLAVLAVSAWFSVGLVTAVSVPAPPSAGGGGMPFPGPFEFSNHTCTIFLLIYLVLWYGACFMFSGIMLVLPASRRAFAGR
jgi:hypothetical protein